jgi:serine/threonine-protein kinase
MAMHQAGLLHRDLKPSNIGFTADGQPKLLDFGLARLAEEAGLAASPYPADLPLASPEPPLGLTRTGQVIGTPLYLSPETLAGTEPAAAQDLWSLHMILWEAIAGRHPFADRPARPALRALAHGRIPDIRASVPSCPPPIAALLSRGFEPEPGKRLPSATALRDELLSVLAGFA